MTLTTVSTTAHYCDAGTTYVVTRMKRTRATMLDVNDLLLFDVIILMIMINMYSNKHNNINRRALAYY